MPKSFQLPLEFGKPDQIRFPDCCVCCGAPRQANSTLTVNRLIMRKQRQEAVTHQYAVPHYEQCHRGTKAVFMATFLPFLAGFLLAGGLTFIVVTLYAHDLGLDSNSIRGINNSSIAGGADGLIVGFVSAFLFEGLARLILRPVFGPALWQAPMLLNQFFQDADYVAGLLGKLDPNATHLLLTFKNDDIAAVFQKLNPAARPD